MSFIKAGVVDLKVPVRNTNRHREKTDPLRNHITVPPGMNHYNRSPNRIPGTGQEASR